MTRLSALLLLTAALGAAPAGAQPVPFDKQGLTVQRVRGQHGRARGQPGGASAAIAADGGASPPPSPAAAPSAASTPAPSQPPSAAATLSATASAAASASPSAPPTPTVTPGAPTPTDPTPSGSPPPSASPSTSPSAPPSASPSTSPPATPTPSSTPSPDTRPRCDSLPGSPLHHMPGQWVRRAGAPAGPTQPCCGWDFTAPRSDQCARIVEDPPLHINFTGGLVPSTGAYVPAGGNGCNPYTCTPERVAAMLQWEWAPTRCAVAPWSAPAFCAALGGRRLAFTGDSTMQQLAAGVMNLLVEGAANCTPAVAFVHSDTLIGENLGVYNRGPTWLGAAGEAGWPDLLVANAGMHVKADSDFARVLATVRAGYEEALGDPAVGPARLPHLVWATSTGAPCANDILPAPPRDIPGYWAAQRAQRGKQIFNHDRMEGWDDDAVAFWGGTPWASVLDLRPLWMRADAKSNPAGCDDPVHMCMPGPFRTVAAWLTAVVRRAPPRPVEGSRRR